jgi:hypothetical protein
MDRRDFLRFAAASGVVPFATGRVGASEGGFDETFHGNGWSEWAKDGVSNLRTTECTGVLEAATNIYPSDRRAVAFRTDSRAKNAAIRVRIDSQQGVGPGVVLRRVGPETYYAAILEREEGALKIIARVDGQETILTRQPVGPFGGDDLLLLFRTQGTDPTRLEAGVASGNIPDPGFAWPDSPEPVTGRAMDATEPLQARGDPGVLSTAETGFRSGPDWKTGTGSRSLRAAWVIDAFEEGDDGGIRNGPLPLEEAREKATRKASTTVFEWVAYDIFDSRPADSTVPSTVAATNLRPTPGPGRREALVSVVTDADCAIEIEVAPAPDFEQSRTVEGGAVNEYETAFLEVPIPADADRFYWRPRLRRDGRESVGPVRSAPALPRRGVGDEVSLAVGSCATQFGMTFESIAEYDPDAFVWHGDLNYLDGSGPLAQTESGYTGMWKDFLTTPELRRIIDRSYFGPQRDDHDYGINDAHTEQLAEYTVEPYEGVVNPDIYYRFGGGLLDVWVPETRRWKDPVEKPDEFPGKTLLGDEQRAWLLNGLRESEAPFKLVCSPGPLFNVPNDSTSWAKAYTAERDHVLDVIAGEVDGRTVFVTGDTHSGCVTRFEWDGRLEILEVRAAPLDIPGPGQHDASSGDTVIYSEQGKFFSTVAVRGGDNEAVMDIALRKQDGTPAWSDTLRTDR